MNVALFQGHAIGGVKNVERIIVAVDTAGSWPKPAFRGAYSTNVWAQLIDCVSVYIFTMPYSICSRKKPTRD